LACGPRTEGVPEAESSGFGAGLGRVRLGHGEAEGMTGGPRQSVTAGAAQAERWAGGPKGQAGYCAKLGRSGWLGRLAATARWARRGCGLPSWVAARLLLRAAGLNWVGEVG
jgi:hypothetical protein